MAEEDDAPALLLSEESRRTRDLLAQVSWFNRLRAFAAFAVIWSTALAAHALDVVADPWPLYSLGATIALVDGCYLLFYPRLLRLPMRNVRRHVFLQITVDLVILTALLHWTGGITNPLVMFYLFHVFIAALVLSERAGFAVGALSLGLVTLLAAVERAGLLPHRSLGLGLMDLQRIEVPGFLLLFFAYATTLGASVYFVATALRKLRAGEAQLVRLGRQLAMSEKLASIGTLAAGVSHEINNPVAVIRNKVQVLRYRLEDGDDPQQLLAELDVVEKHARRIGAITAGLLTFSREAPFELHSVDVGQLVREAADLVRVPFRTASVQLRIGSGPPAAVRGSQNHLLQVLINILLNAKDASAAGSTVSLRWQSAGAEVAIVITDQGAGIPKDALAKIFDPFFTTKDVDKGTGLGLAISHGIVERHAGRIEVRSEPGAGAEFSVLLPRER